MKKVAILFVMVFASATMFAQILNHATVDQHGDWNTVDVLQETEKGPNKLFFTQTGNYNALDATQEIYTDVDGAGDAFNYSSGLQSGDYNTADVMQDGSKNRSYLTQSGYGNEMDLYQTFSQLVIPGDGETPPDVDVSDNYAEATQSGNQNEYKMKQEGFTNVEKLYQHGDGNKAWQDQIAISSVNKSFKYQTGDNNFSDLNQEGLPDTESGQINYSYAKQKGDKNTVNITQSGKLIDNTSDILQSGDENTGRLFQATWGHKSNISTNTETGDENFIKIVQGNIDHVDPVWW